MNDEPKYLPITGGADINQDAVSAYCTHAISLGGFFDPRGLKLHRLLERYGHACYEISELRYALELERERSENWKRIAEANAEFDCVGERRKEHD